MNAGVAYFPVCSRISASSSSSSAAERFRSSSCSPSRWIFSRSSSSVARSSAAARSISARRSPSIFCIVFALCLKLGALLGDDALHLDTLGGQQTLLGGELALELRLVLRERGAQLLAFLGQLLPLLGHETLQVGALRRELLPLDALLLDQLGADAIALRLALGHGIRHADERQIERELLVGGGLLEQALRLLEQPVGEVRAQLGDATVLPPPRR